jgi:hypothetical protein
VFRSRAAILAVTVLVLALALMFYVRVGWDRMDAHCSATPPGSETADQVYFSWRWNPPGFTCTYIGGQRDGDAERSLWF